MKEFSESGGEGEGDEDDDDHLQDDRLGDGGGFPERSISSSKLASICLLDKTISCVLSTEDDLQYCT